MNARAANSVFHAMQGIARSVQKPAPTRIDIARTVRDWADQDDLRIRKLGFVTGKISGAAYGGTAYAQIVDAEDIAALRSFLEHAEADLALADFVVPDTKVDQPHSRDESHYLDREKL